MTAPEQKRFCREQKSGEAKGKKEVSKQKIKKRNSPGIYIYIPYIGMCMLTGDLPSAMT